MDLRKGLVGLALVATTASVQARETDFNYVDARVGIFDLDYSESLVLGADSISLETDDDVSFDATGAWQPWKGASAWYQGVHLFGALGIAQNDLDGSVTVGGVTTSASGDFDIFRARGGLGYGYDISDQWNLYGRLTWDYVELDDISLGGTDLGDVDDNGVGFEAGARWLVQDNFELQLYGRYTDVGSIANDGGDDFEADDDALIGVEGRWYFADRWALQVNGEFGDSSLYGAGVRFDF